MTTTKVLAICLEHLIRICHFKKERYTPDAMTTINRLRGYKDTFAAHGLG